MAAGCRRYTRYVNGKPQCSGDDSSPLQPRQGLAPLDVTDTNVQRVALRPMVVLRAANQNLLIAGGNHTIIPSADCRRYTRYVSGKPQCSGDDSSPLQPRQGLAPLDVTDTNVQRVALRPMAAGCRRYTRYVNGKPQCSGDDSSPLQPRQGLAPLDVTDTNVQRVALRPMVVLRAANQNLLIAGGNHTIIPSAGCRRYTRYVNGKPQCSGDDSSPLQPWQGLAPLDVTDTNVQRVALRPMAADCRRYTRYVNGRPFHFVTKMTKH